MRHLKEGEHHYGEVAFKLFSGGLRLDGGGIHLRPVESLEGVGYAPGYDIFYCHR